MALALLVAQVLLSFTVEGEGPVRFGFPLPAAALARGLSVEGPRDLALAWRPLPLDVDARSGRQWCELTVAGDGLAGVGPKRLRLRAGGVAPGHGDRGSPCGRRQEVEVGSAARVTTTVWTFVGGACDQRVRTEVTAGTLVVGDESLAVGEAMTEETVDLRARTLRVRIDPREWARAGVVPRPTGLGAPWRRHLCRIGKQLATLPGVRGHGDYGRSGDVVTNLEFDTVLGFLRLGLAEAEPALCARAADSARHLVDHDLEAGSGLPFAHGGDHRSSPPEPGHAWAQGLLLAGCVFADDDWIAAAGSMVRALARQPRTRPQSPRDDRARDLGWPLCELEAWLCVRRDPAVARAADALARELMARYDPRSKVIRFGEGERRGGGYEERAWLSAGILVPGLRAYAVRTRDPHALTVVRAHEARLLMLLRRGRRGLPIRYHVDAGGLGRELRLSGTAEAFMLLDGMAPRELRRVLARGQVAACLEGVPRADDPDVATQFSIAARCEWILR
ncbi:MAG: hypothetical protein R3F56_03275 [Planctomycetota bacterium]